MIVKIFNFSIIFSTIMFASTFDDIINNTLKNNDNLHIMKTNIDISRQDELLSTKWENIVLGLGVNDILLDDLSNRSIEPMQNQFISFSQKIPIGNKLKYKKDISNTNSEIFFHLLEDKKNQYRSSILQYLNEYTILNKKVFLLKRKNKNIKKIIRLQEENFKINSVGQVAIVNSKIMYENTKLRKRKIQNDLKNIKLELQNISYLRQDNIKHTLSKQSIPIVDVNTSLKNNNMYKSLEKRMQKSKQNISLQKAMITNDLNFKVGYYQRKEFDDYLSFSLSYPLSIYGSEDIKIHKSKKIHLKNKSYLSIFENEFRIKIQKLLLDMSFANNNYYTIYSKIIVNKKFVNKILLSQNLQIKLNTIKQLNNDNDIINEKLKALEEQNKFYKAKAKLQYYIGKF